MNPIPQPVDMNKLKGILGKAKAVMNTVNEGTYQPGNIDSSALVQNTDNYLDASAIPQTGQAIPQQIGNPVRQPGQITEAALSKSKMPEAIKKAMMENPIQQSNPLMGQSFTLDDVSDLIEKPMPVPQARPTQRQGNVGQMNESVIQQANDKFTVSESALRAIIKDVLVEYLAADYSKNLTEGVIKKTINTLIKEGKIKTKG